MKVDIGIATAINAYLATERMTARQLAKNIGVTEPTIVMWRRPGRGITDKWWQVIYPLIKPYLPKSRIYIASDGQEHYASAEDKAVKSYNAFGLDSAVINVPLLDEYALRSYVPMAESIEQFAVHACFPRLQHLNRLAGCGGVFAYDLQESKCGVPQGAHLFASTEARPKNGCLVLGVRTGGEITLGKFYLEDGKVTYGGVSFPVGSLRELFTLFAPVLRYEVTCF